MNTLDPKFFQQRSKKFETRDNKGGGGGGMDELYESIESPCLIERKRPLYLVETDAV